MVPKIAGAKTFIDVKTLTITKEGLEALKREKEKLTSARDALVIRERDEEGKSPCGWGDGCETNWSKEDRLAIERKLQILNTQIRSATIISEGSVIGGGGHVTIGSTVDVSIDEGDSETFTITDSVRTDPPNGKISFECPLAQAILGKTIDTSEDFVAADKSKHRVRILAIR